MSWWHLAWRMLAHRPAAALLNLVTLALGLAALVMVLSVSRQLSEHVERDLQGVDLVVGVKGMFDMDPAGPVVGPLKEAAAELSVRLGHTGSN